jgi:spore germination cell wall hydrolase CwlJ-like protein
MKKSLLATVCAVAISFSANANPYSGEPRPLGYSEDDITWLAKNVYFEARNQGVAGQLAVAMVTLNRVEDKRFPNTIKEVVTEGPARPSWKNTNEMIPLRHRCQFSWYCDGKSDKIFDWAHYWKIYGLVLSYVQKRGIMPDITEGATHYHADYVQPAWAKTKTKTTEIEDHIFYRWEK